MTDVSGQVSPEQLTAIRQSLFNSVHADYVRFINSIRALPIHQSSLNQAFIEFDTGILWAKEAIFYGAFVQPQEKELPNQSVEEESKEIETASEAELVTEQEHASV